MNTLKILYFAAAVTMATNPAQADAPLNAAELAQLDRLGRGEIALTPAKPAAAAQSHCRLQAAMVWPNTLDAFENEMRDRQYAVCMSRGGR